jgi:hypothetical protein
LTAESNDRQGAPSPDEALADGVAVGPKPPRHGRIDHCGRWPLRRVGAVEGPALHHWNAHGGEILAGDQRIVGPACRMDVLAFKQKSDLPVVGQWNVGRETDPRDSGQGRYALHHAPLGRAPDLANRVAPSVERRASDQHALRRKARRHEQHFDEAVDEQPRPNKQDYRT